MVIVVHDHVVRLDEPDDLKGFEVRVERGAEDDVEAALDQVGRMVDRDTAWIRADAVRELARGRVPDDWDEGFEAMLDYASSKGWLSDDRTEIQAHIEWAGA